MSTTQPPRVADQEAIETSPQPTIVARTWYLDPLSDLSALAAAARGSAVHSLGYLPTLAVTGKDRASWLNGLLTCDVSTVRPGVGAWGLLLDRVGKVQAVLGVVEYKHPSKGEHFLVGVLWGDAKEVQHQLDMRLVMEDAELELTDDWHWSVCVGALSEAPHEGAAWGNVELAGPCSLVVEPSFAELGSRHLLSDAAWASRRLEFGLPWGGIDFDANARPHEAALDRKAVSWSKGCYLGQEVVCMQDMRGKVKKRLAVFTSTGDGFADHELFATVFRAGVSVGKVTSAVYEPVERRWTLFALVPTAALTATSESPGALPGGQAASSLPTELEWEPVKGVVLPLHWLT